MNVFGKLFKARDKPRNLLNGSGYSFLFGNTVAGKTVNERSAMQMSAVYACVRILSEAIAALPLHFYQYNAAGGKEKALRHPLYNLLHDEPNPEMTAFSFRETLMTHLLLWGKQYERALEAANKKLENAYNRQGRLTESLDAAKQKNADLKQQVAAATKQYERFSRELGESDSATLATKANLDALSQEYAESSVEVKKLEGQLAANTKSLQNNADTVTKARTNLNNAQGALRQTEQQIRTTTERLARMQSAWTKAGDALTAFGKSARPSAPPWKSWARA